ncbi:hypothetical protein A2767_02680 [Candidatus Roizmanbacteria bacterium RIFCSPHIGHO2_01_FULL_35_10]|uniref:Calcineurin-like phosphoesterase domain-containing protein n=1 Tax=Candidatus Roizmanbacteria bacterium RIFCSPLOWO2_01_FULL_35_13 TaxID=1802055 RepID=A0A1F7IF18_9BACT|nr:MAG: hypothetical protein A2767_02680 [Candidatus Roizmanbacteria bacterium RIFCSPHIGHO2_01_FULL_35_10]OGK41950.1 MAG: hypothetical protein A3A74_04605 [Candidatus Roizmanbacteria bacterium RIFCSPLOWO2_01_FULL_35_13]
MKILVFSDSHLTDKFEIKKFNFLKRIISEADQVIINGDFWDGEMTTFNQFIASDWNKLFPILKERKTVYIYGNHDRKSYSNNKVNLFSLKQGYIYNLKQNGINYIIEHGNRFFITPDEFLPRSITRYSTLITGFFMQKFTFLQFILKKANEIMKSKIQKELKNNDIYVCGHSHWSEFDLKNNFINTGCIESGLAQYLIIDDQKITPMEERYY